MTLLLVALLVLQPPARHLAWDHPTSEVSAQIVTRFEVRYDSGPWVDVGMVPHASGPTTPPTHSSFASPVPALVPGPHTAVVRACNVTACTESAALSFVFDVIPTAPSGLRFPGEE